MIADAKSETTQELGPKVADVTGSGSGIEKAFAIALASEGYAGVVSGRNEDSIAVTSQLCRKTPPPSFPVLADVPKPDDVDRLLLTSKSDLVELISPSTMPALGCRRRRSRI